ncbi:MAG: thioredoxin domain-containing protein [Bacteroidota bacterium]
MKQEKYTNQLINSSSPYLLQHAHNPVNWHPWSKSLIEKAKRENKLLLVSIGYAACHWCHVMEHECFEDTEVAEVMNEHFICIKVDREERPDVDNYYMTSVHLMGQQGGWPLNVIALPDGKPIWGGTYFPKDHWMKNILAVADFYRENQGKTREYAESLQNGIEQASLKISEENEELLKPDSQLLDRAVVNWQERFDHENGGNKGAPKFPMPVNLGFLLNYGKLFGDDKVLGYVKLTLEKMARGGIYDQVGGGFARYSVDEKWKVPHFEKMLYDNGQLLSIYSKAYQQFKTGEFKSVIYETAAFIDRELTGENGAQYSSLDADSEGEEGKFYVWKSKELKLVLGDDFPLFKDYYNVDGKGFWEQGKNILLRDEAASLFAAKNNLTEKQLSEKVKNWKKILLSEREKRVRPGLDDKTLTSWSALVIQGLADAYKATGDNYFLKNALKKAEFINENLMDKNGQLVHAWKNGKSTAQGFMEDYALLIGAFISLFEVSGEDHWLKEADLLTNYSFQHFYDEERGLFYFSEKENSGGIVTNHFQNEDNVVPAANSEMANNLYKLYLMLGKPAYKNYVQKMLQNVISHFSKYPMAFANWGTCMLKMVKPYFEMAIIGPDADEFLQELQLEFRPNILWASSKTDAEIPILRGRLKKGKTLIYVCREGTCKLPVENPGEALELIKDHD